MAEFHKHLCWDVLTAAATINTEAVSPSRSVFFATHAPLRIHRSSSDGVTHLDDTVTAAERDVLDDFTKRPPVNGVLLMPVIGESGTGKSHLVRWVHEMIPHSDRRKIIYLPKNQTSLRTVVTTLLAGVQGGDLEQLRLDVSRVNSEIDLPGLERKLLNALNEAVAAAPPASGRGRMLAGPDRLANLLLDPLVRSHLLKPGKLVPQLAASILADKKAGTGDRPLTFTVDDLPLNIADLNQASGAAQELLRKLAVNEELQRAAVEILNEQLPVAVTSAANVGMGRLHNAMLEIRREFARQGKEIILLIEDFALIQGVQRDLLDAIIEVGEREGRSELAPIRTMMAVTTGYYRDRLADTVVTRARAAVPYVYSLDTQFNPADNGKGGTTAFVGRYLNAARIGRRALDELQIGSDDSVPNKCLKCPFQEPCHATFGKTVEGHGLYPFNDSALRRMIKARPSGKDKNAFNPRLVLGEVVRATLIEHAESLRNGTFPNQQFRKTYPLDASENSLPSSVGGYIDEHDPEHGERRKLLLEFWEDAPTALRDVPPELATAFDLPLLELAASTSDEVPSATDHKNKESQPQHSNKPSEQFSKTTRNHLLNIEQWVTRGAVLSAATALELRTIVRKAVIERCLWHDPVMPRPKTDLLKAAWQIKATTVSIEGAASENLAGTEHAPIKFRRNNTNAQFFQGLIKAAAAGSFAGIATHVRRLHEIADTHRDQLVRDVLKARNDSDTQLVWGLRASVLGAALAGKAWPGMNTAELVAAVFDRGQGADWSRADTRLRTPEWLETWHAHRAARSGLVTHLLESFGVSHGTGEIRMIDAARVLPLLERATEQWKWNPTQGDVPQWAALSVQKFANFDKIITQQNQFLFQTLSRIRLHYSTDHRQTEVLRAVGNALEAAVKAGIGPQDRSHFARLLEEAQTYDWKTIEALEKDISFISADDPDESHDRARATAAAVVDRGADLPRIVEFLEAADEWLTNALSDADARSDGQGADNVDRVEKTITYWATIVQEDLP